MSDVVLQQRLQQDCAAHANAVLEMLAAHAAGDLEDALLLRSCALEVHSLKGMVSIIGLTLAGDAIGSLSEQMVRPGAQPTSVFWEGFRSWFSAMITQVVACANGKPDAAALAGLKARREALGALLGRAPAEGSVANDDATHARRQLSPSAGRRLLLVDDSPTVRAAMAARLIDRGYPVRTARSLTETARLLSEFDPEIVVTDVCMPHVEGDELCRRIKAHMRRLVPVLLYSSLPEEELSARARAAGADGYICKIQGVEALIERMDELLAAEILF